MEVNELLKTIKHDFMIRTVPCIALVSSSDLLLHGNELSKKQILHDVSLTTAHSMTIIGISNFIEFSLLNFNKNDLTYEKRLATRFLSTDLASTIGIFIYDKDKSLKNVIVSPLVDGCFSVGVFMLKHKKETNYFLQAKFPRQYAGFIKVCNCTGVTYLWQKISSLFS